MLTSLKVVRIALVACDCSSRSATRARRRDIGTRCSGRSPRLTATGAATAGSGLATAGAGGAERAGGGAVTPRGAGADATSVCSTSPLVTRPSRPVPGTEPAASAWSAISLAAAGIVTSALLPLADADAGAVAATEAPADAAAAGAAPAFATPSVSMRAMTSSLTQLSPSPLTISAITPANGAGTSNTTLSVSISTRISSSATASPGFFRHCNSVASATDSDSCGTLTSTIAISCLSDFHDAARAGRKCPAAL